MDNKASFVLSSSLLFSLVFCVPAHGKEVCLSDDIAQQPNVFCKSEPTREEKFKSLIIGVATVDDPRTKLRMLNSALEKAPQSRDLYLAEIAKITANLSNRGERAFKLFDGMNDHLAKQNASLTPEETKQFLNKLNLSNKDRILFANHFWSADLKALSFDVAFNAEDKKRFENYEAELKAVVIKSKNNPFRGSEKTLWHAMTSRQLWSPLVNYWMCYDLDSNSSQHSSLPAAVVAAMTTFGEEKVRSWVTDLDRRQRWLENPMIVAGYFYQQGMTKEAFSYLEDAGLQDEKFYQRLCSYSGSYDKLVAKFLKKIKSDKQLDRHEQFILAFSAQQTGNTKVYDEALKSFADEEIKDESDQNRQIQRLLGLSEMKKAIQLANKYNRANDVFKLLCLSYDNQTAHQFIQVGKVINPEGIKAAEATAREYFNQSNHRFSEAYRAGWKARSLKSDYENPTKAIEKSMRAEENIHHSLLSLLKVSAEDKQLELKIVEYLTNGKFNESNEERRLLEKHGKEEFLRDHYHARWKDNNYRTSQLYLAGHYAKQTGKVKLGDAWMKIATVNCFGYDRYAAYLVKTIKSVNPKCQHLTNLRKTSRKSFLGYPGGRQSYDDAYEQKAYAIAANIWTHDHLAVLDSSGSYYGQLWWAWHNSAHGNEALGQREIERGNLDKAYEHLLKLRKVSENRYQLGKNLYLAYMKRGDKAQADKIYKPHWLKMKGIHQENPQFHWALSHLVRWSLACRKPMQGQGIEFAKELCKMRGDRYFEHRLLAEHYVLNNQPDKAREVLVLWAERRPRDIELAGFIENLELPTRTLLEDGMYFGRQGWF